MSEARRAELGTAEERKGDADVARLVGVFGVGPVVSLAYATYERKGSGKKKAIVAVATSPTFANKVGALTQLPKPGGRGNYYGHCYGRG